MNKFYLCLMVLPFSFALFSCHNASEESSVSHEEINSAFKGANHNKLAFADRLHKEEISFTALGNARSMDEASLRQYQSQEDPHALVYYYSDDQKTAFIIDFIGKIDDKNILRSNLKALVQKMDPKAQISETNGQFVYVYHDNNGFNNDCHLLTEKTNSYTICAISQEKSLQELANLIQNPQVSALQ